MNKQELQGYQLFGESKFSNEAKQHVLKELEGKSRIGLKIKKTVRRKNRKR